MRKMERQKEEDEKTRELAEAHQKKVDARNARLEGAKQGFVDHRVSIVERRKDKEQYYGVVRATGISLGIQALLRDAGVSSRSGFGRTARRRWALLGAGGSAS